MTQDVLLQKTIELCEAIVGHPQFQSIQTRLNQFLQNESARAQYEALTERGQHLQNKRRQGVSLSEQEINSFEAERKAFLDNPVAADFLEAQEEMHQVQESIGEYVTKTFELGRLPAKADFGEGSCGSGCGCH